MSRQHDSPAPPAAAAAADGAGNPPASVEWLQRVRERLAGTAPRHQPQDWVVPGISGADSAELRRFLPRDPVPAAVLVPLVQRPQPTLLLTERDTRLRQHAGQISFPGGRIEVSDGQPQAAALREAQEEIGLDPSFVTVVGYLPDHVVVTGYRVTPVVALVRPGFELRLDAREVADTFEVPLSYLFDPVNQRVQRRRSGFTGREGEFRDIPWQGRTIWGATAGMILSLQRILLAPQP
ncbi:MAG: CoA pyrophosphatase [Proteobacteria bacterium]|nr:CoA pyrophosphatase [Pseudomonadota bacterium]